MPEEDRRRWDERYLGDDRFQGQLPPHRFLQEHISLLPAGGLAIDFAAGLGASGGFLLGLGFRVIAADFSAVALRRARQSFPGLMAVQADLDRFPLPEARFDVLLNFFYLNRALFPAYPRALRPGGVLVMQTLTLDFQTIHPEIEDRFLLRPGELRSAFPGLETLVYEEGWTEGRRGHPRATASILARKPAAP